MPAVHILQGLPQDYERLLRRTAGRGGGLSSWTVPKAARTGDVAVFYLSAPVSAFIVRGSIASNAWRESNRRDSWYGRYFASVDRLESLPRDVGLAEVRRRYPNWAYLRSAQGTVTVPPTHTRMFLRYLSAPGTVSAPARQYSDATDIEGITTETVALRRTRSERLRRLALARAGGVCEACGHDYSRLLHGRGLRVLQVHHRRQLSLRDRPRRTHLEDIAVLCANCHLLVHSEPRRPLRVEDLRRMLRTRGV